MNEQVCIREVVLVLDYILDHDLDGRYLVGLERLVDGASVLESDIVGDLAAIVNGEALHGSLPDQNNWRILTMKVLGVGIVEEQLDRLAFKGEQIDHVLLVQFEIQVVEEIFVILIANHPHDIVRRLTVEQTLQQKQVDRFQSTDLYLVELIMLT